MAAHELLCYRVNAVEGSCLRLSPVINRKAEVVKAASAFCISMHKQQHFTNIDD